MTNASTAPLIGILARHDKSVTYRQSAVNAQNEAYLHAVTQVGGIPFIIPLNLSERALRRLYDLADGLLFAGGGDIDPALYGAKPLGNESDMQRDRDDAEIQLVRWAAADDKPVLAICRGIQIIAVAMGGSLVQDLPSQMPQAERHNHRYLAEDGHKITDLIHDVELSPSSKLTQALGTTRLRVNSMHHQAVKAVSAPLTVVGQSEDGVIEAIELPTHRFFVGVQWHPEVLVDTEPSAQAVLSAFVTACNGR